MKKLLFGMPLSLLCFLLSCKDASSPATASTPGSDSTASAQADKNTANTKIVFQGIETGDLSKMNDFVASDAVDHSAMGDIKGLDSIKKVLADMHNHISNIKLEIISDASSPDYHFSLVKMTGTVKDDFMGMPANTNISDTTLGVEKIVNGKVTDHWEFVDPRAMMKAMPMQHPNKKK